MSGKKKDNLKKYNKKFHLRFTWGFFLPFILCIF